MMFLPQIEWNLQISLGNVVTVVTLLFAGLSVFYGLRERQSLAERELLRISKDIADIECKLEKALELVFQRLRELENKR